MKILVSYDRRKWTILMLVYVFYICTESFLMAVLSPLVLDLVLVFPQSPIFMIWLNQKPDDVNVNISLLVDLLIRTGIIVLGAVLNAFFSYVFDLTFYRGTVLLLSGVVFFLYAWYALLPLSYIHTVRVVDTSNPAFASKFGIDIEKRDVTEYFDYVFMILIAFVIAASTEVYVFAEPWTYATVLVYHASVMGLMAIGDIKTPENMYWWALLIFVLFWSAVMVWIYFQFELSRKHELSTFFED